MELKEGLQFQLLRTVLSHLLVIQVKMSGGEWMRVLQSHLISRLQNRKEHSGIRHQFWIKKDLSL